MYPCLLFLFYKENQTLYKEFIKAYNSPGGARGWNQLQLRFLLNADGQWQELHGKCPGRTSGNLSSGQSSWSVRLCCLQPFGPYLSSTPSSVLPPGHSSAISSHSMTICWGAGAIPMACSQPHGCRFWPRVRCWRGCGPWRPIFLPCASYERRRKQAICK
jgi:hypothetical protein